MNTLKLNILNIALVVFVLGLISCEEERDVTISEQDRKLILGEFSGIITGNEIESLKSFKSSLSVTSKSNSDYYEMIINDTPYPAIEIEVIKQALLLGEEEAIGFNVKSIAESDYTLLDYKANDLAHGTITKEKEDMLAVFLLQKDNVNDTISIIVSKQQ